jgi:tRNA 2-thiouridine synthesizing protein A
MSVADTGRTLIDSRGSSCPGPITDLALAYRRSKVGDVIELWATDPGVKPDVQAWASKTGNRIVSLDEDEDKITVVIEIVRR